jgi:hypothetical protein
MSGAPGCLYGGELNNETNSVNTTRTTTATKTTTTTLQQQHEQQQLKTKTKSTRRQQPSLERMAWARRRFLSL